MVKQGMMVNVDSIIPNSLRGIYTSRVDHLSQTQQVVVKVASIVGRYINFSIFHFCSYLFFTFFAT